MSKKVEAPQFSIKKLNLITLWKYNVDEEVCSICKCGLQEMCPECSLGTIAEDTCYIVHGVCCHAFHAHCIESWLQKNKACPICHKVWEIAKSSHNKL